MSKIISLHSFRRGTGKSTLVANLTAVLAAEGRRVGVIDTDIQSPGLHLLLGLDEAGTTHTLNDYLGGDCDLQQAAWGHVVRKKEPIQNGCIAPGSLAGPPGRKRQVLLVQSLVQMLKKSSVDLFQQCHRRFSRSEVSSSH